MDESLTELYQQQLIMEVQEQKKLVLHVKSPEDGSLEGGGADNTFTELTSSPPTIAKEDLAPQKIDENDFFSVEDDLPPYMRNFEPEQKTVEPVQKQDKAESKIDDFQAFLTNNPSVLAQLFAEYQQQRLAQQNGEESVLAKPTQTAESQRTVIEIKSNIYSNPPSQASSQESKDQNGKSFRFDPSKLTYKNDEPESDQVNRFHEEMVNPHLNKYASKFDVCSVHPKMKKNHISIKDQQHLCDSCIISEGYRDHQTAPLSKIALEIYSQFSTHFKLFQQNLTEIQRIDAKSWKANLRKNYLNLFNELFTSLFEIRDSKINEINSVFKQIDVEEVNQFLNSMKVSHDLAKSYSDLITTMFEQNQYSAIATRQCQFNILGDSMSYLVNDCQDIVELVDLKRRKLESLSDQMGTLVHSLQSEAEERLKKVSQDWKLQELNKYEEKQQKESIKLRRVQKEARTGFYYFMKENREKLTLSAPKMKAIEVIAFLQAKWSALSAEDKLTYEMMSTQPEGQERKVSSTGSDKKRDIKAKAVQAEKELAKQFTRDKSSLLSLSDGDETVSEKNSSKGVPEKQIRREQPIKSILKPRKLSEREQQEITSSDTDEMDDKKFIDAQENESNQRYAGRSSVRTAKLISQPVTQNQAKPVAVKSASPPAPSSASQLIKEVQQSNPLKKRPMSRDREVKPKVVQIKPSARSFDN